MMRRLRLPTSNEEKVAKRIGTILSDYSLDLEAVGKYMALSNPHLIYSRAIEVLEAMQYNKEVAEYREMGKYYEEKLF
jgi:hypothetical protein